MRQGCFESPQYALAVVAYLAARYGHDLDAFCLQFGNLQPVALKGDPP